jgi:hypothetical protein
MYDDADLELQTSEQLESQLLASPATSSRASRSLRCRTP